MKPSDLTIILNGVETVARAFIRVQEKELNKFWKNSSLRTISKSIATTAEETVSSTIASSGKQNPAVYLANEIKERSSMVVESVKQYSAYVANQRKRNVEPQLSSDFDFETSAIQRPEDQDVPINYNEINELENQSPQPFDEPLKNSNAFPSANQVTNDTNIHIISQAYTSEGKIKEPINSSAEFVKVSSQPNIPKYHTIGKPAVYLANEIKERSSMVVESVKQYSAYVANQRKRNVEPQLSSDFDFETSAIQRPEDQDVPINYNEINELENQSPQPFDEPLKNSNAFPSANQVTNDTNIHIISQAYTSEGKIKEPINSSAEFVKVSSQPNIPKYHTIGKLSERARERKVPSSRISRLMSYGGLAAGMGLGAAAEIARRSLGLKSGKAPADSLLNANPFLTEANANRIVDTLCKVRGAALKLGQMLSIQDNSMINPQLAAVFERVRQSADFMPSWQMERVLKKELGSDWRSKFSEFDPKPFAAASIGQVHCAKLLDGTDVALKIQYPGVAEGIESDIKSLMGIVNFWNILPAGLYLENVMAVAERELKKEVNYLYEADAGKRFKKLLEDFPQFLVPQVYDNLCTSNVLTTELVYGTPIDKLENVSQEIRNEVCEQLLMLCLKEVFIFRFMQTDPNWANFLYNFDSKQIVLLDFGACNEYTPDFVDTYMKIIKGSADQDRDEVLRNSQELGFLTGYETKVMEEAHVDAVMILGEAFACKKPFDFKQQNMTHRIHHLVPIMLKHRLTPPPDETYSLHRKMSGIFLLCTKLGAVIDCRKIFDSVYDEYCAAKSSTV